ncbi:MAG: HPr family phosphocarrier protein [Bacillota bacterium]
MKKKKVTINNAIGLHARPASLLINNAVQFDSEMKMIYEGNEANLKSIISLMSLAIGSGEEVTIKADGADEDEALDTIVNIIENGFKS